MSGSAYKSWCSNSSSPDFEIENVCQQSVTQSHLSERQDLERQDLHRQRLDRHHHLIRLTAARSSGNELHPRRSARLHDQEADHLGIRIRHRRGGEPEGCRVDPGAQGKQPCGRVQQVAQDQARAGIDAFNPVAEPRPARTDLAVARTWPRRPVTRDCWRWPSICCGGASLRRGVRGKRVCGFPYSFRTVKKKAPGVSARCFVLNHFW